MIMMNFGQLLCTSVLLFSMLHLTSSFASTVDDLVRQWAPLVWLSPGEKFMPYDVDSFLNNVYVADENGKRIFPKLDRNVSQYRTKGWHLNTYRPIGELLNDTNSYLYGSNPTENSVPIYALVSECNSSGRTENDVQDNAENVYFHVAYWIFYPYNLGKEVCVIGNIPTVKLFNTCIGSTKTLGNHIGDWEHMSSSFFKKNSTVPNSLYVAVHDAGAYYTYNEENRTFQFQEVKKQNQLVQTPKFPKIVRTQGDHPVLFSANGSHGLWSTAGENEYNKLPKLTDRTGYGTPWKTWNNIQIYHLGKEPLPYWMNFRGTWGNPKKNCLLIKKLGLCEYFDGPEGIIRQNQDYYC
ncbi:unnamed protein product [Phyllotreta striolata]|uniref:Vacuolar protein sorting-associated protein 62 n=1 Tax=Phyllotreta striolata TaxID=444603 RepID=A0A9N9TV34_PHYSR|nr:unnamed protein product [Phyllotreta striolata]